MSREPKGMHVSKSKAYYYVQRHASTVIIIIMSGHKLAILGKQKNKGTQIQKQIKKEKKIHIKRKAQKTCLFVEKEVIT